MMIASQMPLQKMDLNKLVARIQNDELDTDTLLAIRFSAVQLEMGALIEECDKKPN